jgi:3',5'-cyclic-AMP phosphodiesterase
MSVRFVIFGDTKGKDKGINTKVLERIMSSIRKLDLKPDFFVVLGDTVAGSEDLTVHKRQLEGFKGFVNSYFPRTLILPVIGNHEVNNLPVDDIFERLVKDVYINFRQHGSLENYNNTAFHMDLSYCRCIVLNCYHKGEIRKITNEQLEWFKKISSIDKKFKIVFLHCPPFPTGAHLGTCLDEFTESRDEFFNIACNNKIDIIFAGHEHNYSRTIIDSGRNKLYQVVSGGGGEKLRDSFKCKNKVIVPPKALYHFIVGEMDHESIKLKAVSIEGKIIDDFEIKK